MYTNSMRIRKSSISSLPATGRGKRARGRRGFALIATLTLMMLLAMLAVGVLAMASSQSRISMQAVMQAQARQQALVGLDAAIAQLQVELGPDRRVTASSSILNNDDGAPGGHLLGVWNSWDGPIYGSSMTTGGKIQSTYAPGRPNAFRRWLISSLKPEDTRSMGAAQRLASRKPGERICLLGEGTLGPTASHAHYVYADMVPMPRLSENDPNTGCFAWWVCGENQKARVAVREQEKTNDPIEVLHRTWNTPSAKFTSDSELNFLPEERDRPERVLSLPSLPLLADTTEPAGMPYFFDATVNSLSVPVNVRAGGLKQDLCLLFNKESLMGTEFACRSSQDCPIAEGNDVPKGTEPNMPIGSYQNLYAYYNSYPNGNQSDNAFAARMQGRLGQDLYTRMSGSATDVSGATLPSPDTPGKMSFYDTRAMMDSGSETAGYARTPVMLAFLSNYAYVTKQITEWDDFARQSLINHCSGTCKPWFPNEFPEGPSAWQESDGGYYAYLAYTPLVLWWNPYNVEMRIPAHKLWSFSTPFRQIWLRKLNGCIGHVQWVDLFVNRWAAYGLIGQDADSVYGKDGGDYYEAEGGGMKELVFKPGEILFFSPTTARSNDEKNKLHSNPWSVGVHQNSLSGYTYRIVGNVIPTKAVRDRAGTRRGLYPVQIAIGVDERFQPGLTDNEENPADPHGWKLVPGRPDAYTVVSGFGGMSDNDSVVQYTDSAVLQDKGGMSPQRMLLGWIDRDRGVTEPGNGDEHYDHQHLNSIPICDEDSWAEFMNDPKMPYFVVSLGVVAKSANAAVDTRVYPGKDYRTKLWQHSSPAFWGSAILDPDDQTRRYHPYQLAVLPTSTGLCATPLDNVGNNGILGIAGDAGEQVSFASVMEIPVHPPFSLAGFAGMRLQPGWYQTTGGDKNGISQLRRMQYQAGVPGVGIGNSFADPCLPAGDVYAYFEQRELGVAVTGNTHIFGDFFDHGLLINDALWDRWFCSSVSDMPGGSGKIKAEDTLQKFMKGAEPLPVARYKKVYSPYRDEQVIQHIMGGDGWKHIAQFLMVDGGFNVNSTSVAAWTAVLQGLSKRKLVAQKDGRLTLVEPSKGDDEVLFSRFMASTTDKSIDSLGGYSVMQGSPQLRSGGGGMATAWGEVRLLQPESIARLAEEMVKQVRKRGPFLNMSDFINRRLDAEGGENALKGALQAAIDATDINDDFNEVILPQPESGRLFKFPQADAGSMHTAAPGYLIQSDVLASLGNILTVRDDTFTVRAYGCVRGKDGAVLAQAWCEATVQRTAEYLSPVNAPSDADFNPDGTKGDANLSQVNRLLGRKMRVVAFKWMDPWDI